MARVYVFALTAVLNPALLAAVTLMLPLTKPKRRRSGYLLGALLTSVTCGIVLVFVLPNSSTSSTAKRSVDPILNIVLGAMLLVIVLVVVTGRDKRRQAWNARRHGSRVPAVAPAAQSDGLDLARGCEDVSEIRLSLSSLGGQGQFR